MSMLDCAAAIALDGDFDVLVACSPSTPLWDEAVSRGIPTCHLRFPEFEGVCKAKDLMRSACGALATGVSLGNVVRRRQVELIHANGIKAALPAAVGAVFARVPFVFHVRDYPRNHNLYGLVSKSAKATIVPSRFIRNAMPSSCSRVHVVPNGIDCSCSAPARHKLRKELNLHPDTILVTTVAQLVRWKRQDLFVKAAAILASDNDNIHFCVVGGDIWQRNGDYQALLLQMASRLPLKGKLTFLGHREDVAEIICDSDILVLPSDNEPFGRVVVEAWHYGAAVVSADGGGPEELIEDGRTGCLFRRGCAESLASAINRLIADPSLRNRCCAKGLRQSKLYTVARSAKAVAAIYQGIFQ